MESEKLVQFDPTKVLVVAEDNPRYGAPTDLTSLSESIMSEGGVNTPVEVEPLDAPVNGCHHKLLVGYRRHASVLQLNAAGAGLTLPGIVRQRGDNLARLKTQISENRDRRSLSPMDTAVAIKKLFDAGMSKIQVREMFPRPTTGKKKGAVENAPASNAWVNMTLSFLDLPKDIREKIHSGRIGVKAAYELTRVSPEKRADVLKRAEEELEKELGKEATDEEKFLKSQRKIEEAEKGETEAAVAIDNAQKELEAAKTATEEAQKKAAELYTKSRTAPKDKKKEADEAFKAAETDAKGQEKKLAAAQKEVDKQDAAKKKFADAAADARKKLEEARKGAGKPKQNEKGGVSSKAIMDAAAKEGEGGPVALTAAEMRKFIDDLSLAVKPYPKVADIGRIIKEHFLGGPTDGQTVKKLAAITGEVKSK